MHVLKRQTSTDTIGYPDGLLAQVNGATTVRAPHRQHSKTTTGKGQHDLLNSPACSAMASPWLARCGHGHRRRRPCRRRGRDRAAPDSARRGLPATPPATRCGARAAGHCARTRAVHSVSSAESASRSSRSFSEMWARTLAGCPGWPAPAADPPRLAGACVRCVFAS